MRLICSTLCTVHMCSSLILIMPHAYDGDNLLPKYKIIIVFTIIIIFWMFNFPTNFKHANFALQLHFENWIFILQLLICTSLMTLGFFGITNYVEWGSTLYSKGWIGLEKEIIKKYRKVNINHGDWLIGKEWMARINLVLNVNVQCVLTHIYFVMWSSALSLFKTQRDTKKLVSEGMMRMEIRKVQKKHQNF